MTSTREAPFNKFLLKNALDSIMDALDDTCLETDFDWTRSTTVSLRTHSLKIYKPNLQLYELKATHCMITRLDMAYKVHWGQRYKNPVKSQLVYLPKNVK
uniref:Uncharacterized protein n=1 Tax=Ditylenchus dipsaci TaxID=166011 RepID=A0A915ETK2_9BILA